jgi:hypothetical protein
MIKTKTIRKNSLQQTGKTKCKKSGHKQMRTKRFSKGKTMRGGSFRSMKVKPNFGTGYPKMKNYTKMTPKALQVRQINKTTRLEQHASAKQSLINATKEYKNMYNNLQTLHNSKPITPSYKKFIESQLSAAQNRFKQVGLQKTDVARIQTKLGAIKNAIEKQKLQNVWINKPQSQQFLGGVY